MATLHELDSLCNCVAIISLQAAVNLLVMGKAPNEISAYIAGAGLTVLNKSNPGGVHPISPLLVNKQMTLCSSEVKAAEFCKCHQYGVACTEQKILCMVI